MRDRKPGLLGRFAGRHPDLWSRLGRVATPIEHATKGPTFGCQMCGQCILHNTGLTCPMNCPKEMRNGPCGGVGPNGECEVKPEMTCVWLKAYERDPKLPWKGHIQLIEPPVDWRLSGTSSWMNYLSGADHHADAVRVKFDRVRPEPRTDGRFERLLREGAWPIVGELNPPDGADLDGLATMATSMVDYVDVVSVTEHPSATNHMSSIPAAARIEREGIETIATFTCRDRNRIALQGDLLGAAGLGIRNVLLVTGNHMVIGDHPQAKPVFDLDSINLLRLARRLRDQGTYESGRALESRPRLLLGAAAGAFAPPRAERARRIGKKAAAGADFVISQHVFEIDRWGRFVAELGELGVLDRVFVLGAVAVLPTAAVAHRLNRHLTGFVIPDETVRRMERSPDPRATGIEIAAETVRALREMPGVSGCLVAVLSDRAHVMTTHEEEIDVGRAVVTAAGVAAGARRAGAHPGA
jgi:methylenetetrahydrofolate reductase (NADPH)